MSHEAALHLLHHHLRPTDIGDIDIGRIDPATQQFIALRGVDAAIEQLHILLLAAEDEHEVQARQIAVLQIFEFILEDHARRRAVTVEQGEAAVRLKRQRGLDQRQHRRDAAAGDEGHVMTPRFRLQRHVEMPGRRHDLDGAAGLQMLGSPVRELAIINTLDRNAQRLFLRTRADRVRATNLLPFDLCAQGQMLPRKVAEVLGMIRRCCESHDNGVAGFGRDRGHAQLVKLAHVVPCAVDVLSGT